MQVAAASRFGSADGEQAFRIDPIPRLIDAARMARAGGRRRPARARARAVRAGRLRRAADRAGRRRAGALPRRRPPLRARPDGLRTGRSRSWITVAGLDVVRDSDGSFKVLEDNLRTPSGIAYAVATREVLGAHLQPPSGLRVRSLDAAFQTLGEALRAAAPSAAGEDPMVVLLSDGRRNSAFYEHATIAGNLGMPLVLAEAALGPRAGACTRSSTAASGPSTSSTGAPTRTGSPTITATPPRSRELLLEPILAGTLACVNAFGTGVADDKLVHAYVEDMVRFYLDEEPLLQSVHDLRSHAARRARGDPRAHRRARDQAPHRPRRLRRGDRPARPPRGCARPRRRGCPRAPERFVAQEMVMLSRHPTVTDGRLEPRHIDLRPFAISSGETPCTCCRAASPAWPSTRARSSSTPPRTAAARTRGCWHEQTADRRHRL